MKKIFLGLLIAIVLTSVCYGAENDDVYVRRDVFDAKMETFFERIDKRFEQLDKKIDTAISELRTEMRTAISNLRTEMRTAIGEIRTEMKTAIGELRTEVKTETTEIKGDMKALSAHMDGFEKRMDFVLVLLAVLLVLPYVNKWFEKREDKKDNGNKTENFTLDDVRRIIAEDVPRLVVEEIDLRFSTKSQES